MKTTSATAKGANKVPRRRPDAAVQRSPSLVVPKLSHIIADRLRERMARGELRQGDTLPPEAELVRQFGVSRPILRESLRVLEAESLIALGRGTRAGAMVLSPSPGTAAKYGGLYLATQGTTLGEIHEVRTLLEPTLAALLAQRHDQTVIDDLRACVADQKAAAEASDHAATIAAVNEFHQCMIGHSRNGTLRLLVGIISDISVSAYPKLLLSRPNQKAIRARTQESMAAHEHVLKLIAGGKSAQAEAFWRKYMQETAQFMVKHGLANMRVDSI